MSRIRKNIEYYRIPDDIETDIGSNNVAENFNVVNQGNVANATNRQIKNVAYGGPDVNDAVAYGQLDGAANFTFFTTPVSAVFVDRTSMQGAGGVDRQAGNIVFSDYGVPSDADGVILKIIFGIDRQENQSVVQTTDTTGPTPGALWGYAHRSYYGYLWIENTTYAGVGEGTQDDWNQHSLIAIGNNGFHSNLDGGGQFLIEVADAEDVDWVIKAKSNVEDSAFAAGDEVLGIGPNGITPEQPTYTFVLYVTGYWKYV